MVGKRYIRRESTCCPYTCSGSTWNDSLVSRGVLIIEGMRYGMAMREVRSSVWGYMALIWVGRECRVGQVNTECLCLNKTFVSCLPSASEMPLTYANARAARSTERLRRARGVSHSRSRSRCRCAIFLGLSQLSILSKRPQTIKYNKLHGVPFRFRFRNQNDSTRFGFLSGLLPCVECTAVGAECTSSLRRVRVRMVGSGSGLGLRCRLGLG